MLIGSILLSYSVVLVTTFIGDCLVPPQRGYFVDQSSGPISFGSLYPHFDFSLATEVWAAHTVNATKINMDFRKKIIAPLFSNK